MTSQLSQYSLIVCGTALTQTLFKLNSKNLELFHPKNTALKLDIVPSETWVYGACHTDAQCVTVEAIGAWTRTTIEELLVFSTDIVS